MLQRSLVATLMLVTWSWPLTARADEPKTADEVIAKYIEAIGGRPKLDSVKSMRMTGKAIAMSGMEIPVIIEFKRPKKVRVEFVVQGMTGVQAFDGTVGWFVMPFMGKTDPEKMPPDLVEAIEDQADFDGVLVDYQKKGHQVELVGADDVEGSKAYKLKVTKKGGSVEYHYLDAEYFIPLQIKGKHEFQGTEIEYTISLGDYKAVDGLMVAHAIKRGGMGGDMTFDKIELNVDLADDRFAMPEIKKEETPAAEKPTGEGESAPAQEKPTPKEEKRPTDEGGS